MERPKPKPNKDLGERGGPRGRKLLRYNDLRQSSFFLHIVIDFYKVLWYNIAMNIHYKIALQAIGTVWTIFALFYFMMWILSLL